MKSVSEISKSTELVKAHTAAIDKIEKDLTEKIQAVENEGRDPAWVKERIKVLREEALKAATAELAKLNEINVALAKEKEWWGSTEFVLSTMPLENKFSIIMEAEHMSTNLLYQHLRHASENQEAAKFYLLATEMNRRDVKPEGWKGVDFSTVNLPIQKEALSSLSTAQANFNEAVVTMRKINGNASVESIAISKLALAHGASGV